MVTSCIAHTAPRQLTAASCGFLSAAGREGQTYRERDGERNGYCWVAPSSKQPKSTSGSAKQHRQNLSTGLHVNTFPVKMPKKMKDVNIKLFRFKIYPQGQGSDQRSINLSDRPINQHRSVLLCLIEADGCAASTSHSGHVQHIHMVYVTGINSVGNLTTHT